MGLKGEQGNVILVVWIVSLHRDADAARLIGLNTLHAQDCT